VSSGSAEFKNNYFVGINGLYFGEAACSVFYGPKESEILADLEKGCQYIDTVKNISLAFIREIGELDINPVSKSALVTAALHYVSGVERRFPWDIFNLDEPPLIHTLYTVSIDEPELMIKEIRDSNYPIIKIKMGFDEDELLIPELKKISGKIFRIDANGGWSPEKAERMIFLLSKIGIVLIEQPTKIDAIDNWPHLKGKSNTELIIDEGLNFTEDYFRYADYIDGINIKMSKAGGIIEAVKIAKAAHKDSKKVMLGCMLESSIGIAPAVYMASLGDYYDLDGPLLLEKDFTQGINFSIEKIFVTEDIIGGPKLNREMINE
jgi:hypothetical protein